MKKSILVLALLVLTVACIFAGTHNVKADMTVYGFQGITSSEKDAESIKNKYGLGGGLAYEYDINDNWFAGLGVRCLTSCIEGRENFTDVLFLPRAGFRFAENGKFDAYAQAEFGLALKYCEKENSSVMTFGVAAGARYEVCNQVKVFGELENLYAFSKSGNTNFGDYKLNVNLGVDFAF